MDVKCKEILNYTDSDWLKRFPIAHRGYHSIDMGCPENSMHAFEKAIKKRFAIELDVQLLSDQKVVVFHDMNAKRMTGLDKAISSSDSHMVEKLRLLGTDQHIPLLEEVLELVRGKVPLLIEIKNRGKAGKLENALSRSLSDYEGEYAIQSFNPYSLRWFRIHAPHIPRGQLAGDFRGEKVIFYKKFLLKNLLLNRMSLPGFINYDIKCLPHRVTEKFRKMNIPVIGWTARSHKEYACAKKWCDNVVFEGFDPTKAVEK